VEEQERWTASPLLDGDRQSVQLDLLYSHDVSEVGGSGTAAEVEVLDGGGHGHHHDADSVHCQQTVTVNTVTLAPNVIE